MRSLLASLLLFPLLLACSDGEDRLAQPDPPDRFAFLDYVAEAQPRGGRCHDSVDVSAPLIVTGFGFNHANTRNQASLIDAGNVHELAIDFHVAPADASEKRGAPAVTAQAIFLTSGRQLTAINRLSGCEYWSFTTPEKGGSLFRSSSILFVPANDAMPATVYAGDFNGFVYAVNAASGEPLWQTFAGSVSFYHFITGGMQYHAGRLFVPVASKEVLATVVNPIACCISHGMLVALDATTGDTLWQYHTTAEATETILPGERIGPNGASVWSTPTLDIARNALYIGTGQNYTEPATQTSDAIISLDMDTGAVNWIFQARANDTWNGNCTLPASLRCSQPPGQDFDFGAAPILLDDGKTLIAGDKGGVVYSLAADTGALNWSTRVSKGSTLGGIHWGMAVDAERVYVAATDFSIEKATGGLADLIEGARPGIYALDLERGSIEWQIRPTHLFEGLTTPSLYSASLTVSNDLLLAGSLDGMVRAFHTADGRELWSLDTAVGFTDINGVPGNGGTIDSVGVVVAGDGLLINSGYSTFQGVDGRYQAGAGNALFVLGLPR
ncbi:MAG: PQQ-binding-like beta-propeller repeat protein [Halioglobus sp.]|nr:PQQ-binding-like beta-propeller repeat protein [Halioglobus sp.]